MSGRVSKGVSLWELGQLGQVTRVSRHHLDGASGDTLLHLWKSVSVDTSEKFAKTSHLAQARLSARLYCWIEADTISPGLP